jgi:hypothetical protein
MARQNGEAELPAKSVAGALLKARKGKKEAAETVSIKSKVGKPMISLISASNKGLNLRIHSRSLASRADLRDAFIELIDNLDDAELFYAK